MLSTATLSGLDSTAAVSFLTSTYAERYTAGRARGKKLVLIGEKATGRLREAVCHLASAEIRNSNDSVLYRKLLDLRPEADSAPWLERVERENRVRRSQLDENLKAVRSEASKEPIRLALKDLGLFFQETGDGANAIKVLFQGKDNSSNQSHHLEMALLVTEAGLDFGRFDYASPFAQKAEQLLPPSPPGAKLTGDAQKVRLALGLCDLERKRYKSAAKNLLQINGDLKFSSFISNEDVATIAVLCALATFSRNELKENLIDNTALKPMLESVPVVKELLLNFYASKYGSLVWTLQQALPVLSVDPFLGMHAESILRDIKIQALLQCVTPYSCLKLQKLAGAFESEAAMIEAEISNLISTGRIQARIDSQNKTIVARADDKRDVALKAALEASEHVVRESKSMLLRLNMLENFMVYSPTKARSGSSRVGAPSMLSQSGIEEYGDGDSGEEGYEGFD